MEGFGHHNHLQTSFSFSELNVLSQRVFGGNTIRMTQTKEIV